MGIDAEDSSWRIVFLFSENIGKVVVETTAQVVVVLVVSVNEVDDVESRSGSRIASPDGGEGVVIRQSRPYESDRSLYCGKSGSCVVKPSFFVASSTIVCVSLFERRRDNVVRSVISEAVKKSNVFDTILFQHITIPLYTAEIVVMSDFISRKHRARTTRRRKLQYHRYNE